MGTGGDNVYYIILRYGVGDVTMQLLIYNPHCSPNGQQYKAVACAKQGGVLGSPTFRLSWGKFEEKK